MDPTEAKTEARSTEGSADDSAEGSIERATLAVAARGVLRAGVEAMRSQESGAIAGEAEPLHQMRVATRRLRAAVALFRSVLHGSRERIYTRDLPWIGHAAGAVRECDAIGKLIAQRGDRLTPDLAGSMREILEAMAVRRREEHRKFVNILESKRYSQACARLCEPILRAGAERTEMGIAAPVLLKRLVRSVFRAARHVKIDAEPRRFHRLRIKIKRMRYCLEIVEGSSADKRIRKALARLEDMQEILGQHQDAVVAKAWLSEFAIARGASPTATLTAGALIQSFSSRREKLASRGCQRWQRFQRSGVLEAALEEIAREARKLRAAERARTQYEAVASALATESPALTGEAEEETTEARSETAGTKADEPTARADASGGEPAKIAEVSEARAPTSPGEPSDASAETVSDPQEMADIENE